MSKPSGPKGSRMMVKGSARPVAERQAGDACFLPAKDGFQTEETPRDRLPWDIIRADYEIGVKSLPQIAAEHRITVQKITARARYGGWPKRAEVKQETAPRPGDVMPEDAEALATRLTRLIAREIAAMERADKPPLDEAEGERQARRLASLVRSIEKLREIEQAASAARKNDPTADRAKRHAENERLRTALEQRLARIFAAEEAANIHKQADAEGSSVSVG